MIHKLLFPYLERLNYLLISHISYTFPDFAWFGSVNLGRFMFCLHWRISVFLENNVEPLNYCIAIFQVY